MKEILLKFFKKNLIIYYFIYQKKKERNTLNITNLWGKNKFGKKQLGQGLGHDF